MTPTEPDFYWYKIGQRFEPVEIIPVGDELHIRWLGVTPTKPITEYPKAEWGPRIEPPREKA